jgi:phage terminase large subunit-like protein
MSDVVVRPPSAPRIDPYNVAVKYAKDVITGEIVTGKLVKLAAKRFIQDLKFGPARGITFDKFAAQHVVDFFGTLRHFKGEWGLRGGQPFVLSDWQVFILANLFGFKRADGTRRFRIAHIEVARKNGKTTWAAGIGLYMLVADDEPAAEVYVIATTRDQSKEVFDAAVHIRNKSPLLASKIASHRNNLSVLLTASKFEPQSADYGTADGKNVHCLIADELHQHPTRLLWDAYVQATGARRQWLAIAITTAGYDTHGICFSNRKIAENILVGNVETTAGDDIFAYVACIDEADKEGKGGDDPKDESCWIKANPNLGVSVKLDNLRSEAARANIDPTALNSFLCKRLNMWVSQEVRWMPPAVWAKCNVAGPLANPMDLRKAAIERLKGRRCIAGLDLGSKNDMVAAAFLFPPTKAVMGRVAIEQTREQKMFHQPVQYREVEMTPADPKWSVLVWFWVPEGCIQERTKKDRVHYDVWQREGYLNTCPGKTIIHEFVYAQITALCKQFQCKDIAFDAWNAQWIANKLHEDGIKASECRMGFKTMSEPMKELFGMALEQNLEHYGDPVLAWNAGNVAEVTDPAGNVKPDKEKSKEKIDGIVAIIMALSRVCADPTLAEGGSGGWDYSKGIIFL